MTDVEILSIVVLFVTIVLTIEVSVLRNKIEKIAKQLDKNESEVRNECKADEEES